MSSWLAISDFKLLDWGTVPSNAFLYAHTKYPSIPDNKRVLYCNLAKPMSGTKNETIFALTGITTNKNASWKLYVTNEASSTHYIVSRVKFELYTNIIDISTLTTSNVPDGTGVSNNQEFARMNNWSWGYAYTTNEQIFERKIISVKPPLGAGDVYKSMRIYLDTGQPAMSSEMYNEIDCTGISQLSSDIIDNLWYNPW